MPETEGRDSASAQHLGHEALDAIVDRAPDAIIAVGPDGLIVFANHTTEELFGFHRDELHGQPIDLLVPERFRTHHATDRREFLAAPEARPMGAGLELRALRADGEEIDVDISLAPVETSAGVLVVAAVRDASARREAQADRLELMNALERQLERERVAADIHDDLIQSVYAVGLGLLEAERDPAVTKAAALERAKSELSETIDELRSYIRWLREPDESASREPLASRLRSLLGGTTAGAQWELEFDFAEEDIPQELQRHAYLIAKELVSNVHRHATPGPAALSIRRRDDALIVSARDEGPGFDPDSLPEGAFGLSGLRARAQAIGGTIRIDSSPGEPTEVKVELPLTR